MIRSIHSTAFQSNISNVGDGTEPQTDIATYRLKSPIGRFSENATSGTYPDEHWDKVNHYLVTYNLRDKTDNSK